MRVFIIGFAAAIAFSAINGAMYYFSEGKESFLFFGIFGAIPIDWALIGLWMGMAVGLAHRGYDEADNAAVFTAGCLAALFCTFLTHAIQMISISGFWDINAFIAYLGIFGEAWNIGKWYMWPSSFLAALTGGFFAVFLSAVQRADNIRTSLPIWVSPTVRILIRVARADGRIDEKELDLILALLRGQIERSLKSVPKNIDRALYDVMVQEFEAIKNGVVLRDDLRSKCFSSTQQRLRTAKMAIAVAQADGGVSEDEAVLPDQMLAIWEIDLVRREELAAGAFQELKKFV